MKIMLDTNVLFSALIYGGKVASPLLEYVNKYHKLYLPVHAIEELEDVTIRKEYPKAREINRILAKLKYTLVKMPPGNPKEYMGMSDKKDIPILRAAVVHKLDILITGDKHFNDIPIKKPKIMTMAKFTEDYIERARF